MTTDFKIVCKNIKVTITEDIFNVIKEDDKQKGAKIIIIIEWTKEEIKKLDRKTRKILTINQSLHPRADVDRIYIPRKDGGRGLRMIEQVHEVAILGLAKYIKEKENDYLIKFLKDNQDNTSKNIIKKAEKIEREYTTSSEGDNNRGELKKRIKAYKNEIKEQQKARLMNNWKSKRLHGQYIEGLLERKNTIDISKTFEWLKSSRLKSVTEAYIMAAQGQALRTKNYEKNILKLDVDDKYRLCHSREKT
ncbi:hypothetical protein M8J77_021702 [Diaphorina citri]|nr:hypothetical protein M8J77_021702 [Diaphorina citri]